MSIIVGQIETRDNRRAVLQYGSFAPSRTGCNIRPRSDAGADHSTSMSHDLAPTASMPSVYVPDTAFELRRGYTACIRSSTCCLYCSPARLIPEFLIYFKIVTFSLKYAAALSSPLNAINRP